MRSRFLRLSCLLLCALLLFGEAASRAAEPASKAETETSAAETEASLAAAETMLPALAPGTARLSDAAELPEAPEIVSDFGILMEMRSGVILYEKNAYDRAAPASITKIMTALLVMENCNLNDTVTFSYRACHELAKGSSTIARTEGEMMSVRDCLYGLMVASANEVAQGLAEHMSGSIEAFVGRMNSRAEELGCVNTHFANVHGTPDPDHYTCPYDMALIMKQAMQHELLQQIMGTAKYQIAPTNKHSEITYLNSKHPLVTDVFRMRYKGAVAGKTGSTSEALNTLVTYARRGDLDLICVVMHADGPEVVGEDSAALFDYGFANFVRYNMLASAAAAGSDPFYLGSNILDLTASGGCYVTLPNGVSADALTGSVEYRGGLSKNQVAVRKYFLNGVLLAEVPLEVSPYVSRLPLTPEINNTDADNKEKSTKEILRTKYLGLALIYWIIIAGGVVLLALLGLLVFLIVRHFRKEKRFNERSRTLNRRGRSR
ncbi:MAG: D-alanyl-D-alanine carboxypeptidase [Lachnospiraceae bacterium]|nr:D-alanyl-D-alanine carboxypeptidase [Lachnospiraceae bacterium]